MQSTQERSAELISSAEADLALAELLEPAAPVVSRSVAGGVHHNFTSGYSLRPGPTLFAAILSCVCAGSIMVFALYAPQFQTHLGYTQVEVNVLSILGEAGMYLTTPLVGVAADTFGPGALTMASSIFFFIAYLLAAWTYSAGLPYPAMMVAFLFIGCGTACMYFAGITACAKTFTTHRGLGLGLPITAYGLSSLWQSEVIAAFYTEANGDVRVVAIFVSFAIFLAFVGIISTVSYRIAYIPAKNSPSLAKIDEDDPLLVARLSTDSVYPDVAIPELDESGTSPILDFLKDPTAWILAAGLFTTTGPGEMFLNNMGSIIRSLDSPRPSASFNVALLSFSSSATRIAAGLVSDRLALWNISRMWVVLAFTAILAFGHWFVALGGAAAHHGSVFWLVSMSLGSGYGAIFTLAPTLVSLVWGTERFGSNWGVLFLFPAIGSIVYELIYAAIYDHHVSSDRLCYGAKCYETTFVVTGMSCSLAFFLFILVWQIGWRPRGLFV
ncbi:major facilitator superfamily domain-containing protein [Lipomyces oligophaga]|uniref:major facilitator superfamily domain-containing protein n=1 Tax=Lipomyces oligophaga TaxID=45792 RepID=UPI0034CD65F3